MGENGMHIKSCYEVIGNTQLKRYQELQHFKASWKGIIKDYSENIKSSISILQNKSSAVIESTIHYSSRSTTLSNDMNVLDISSFSAASNTTTGINARSNSNGSLIFGIDGNLSKVNYFQRDSPYCCNS